VHCQPWQRGRQWEDAREGQAQFEASAFTSLDQLNNTSRVQEERSFIYLLEGLLAITEIQSSEEQFKIV
jgi:hypothetical protein